MPKVKKGEVKILPMEVTEIRSRFLRAMDTMISTRLNVGSVKVKNRKEFCDLMDMTPQRIFLIEKDNRMPTVEQLFYLIDRGAVSANWLMTGKGTMFGEEEFSIRMSDFDKRLKVMEDIVREQISAKKTRATTRA